MEGDGHLLICAKFFVVQPVFTEYSVQRPELVTEDSVSTNRGVCDLNCVVSRSSTNLTQCMQICPLI